ncbi:MAG: DEAD/DEAH box helicase [Chloroflexi bacterium]|nr:DEAD/DEAH box helicase [Chloroflexota bacterium]
MNDPARIKANLPHTWPVLFSRHGSFTTVQAQAIPPILDGHNTLVIAATASGKTEAVLAPLLERHVLAAGRYQGQRGLKLLYICPTRALVRDLYERMQPCHEALGVSLMMKSGDTGPVSATRPPTVLITTPESTDSLLTRAPRLLATIQAIILDEIHLFDDSPRGDHIRCLLNRIETIRRYHQEEMATEVLTEVTTTPFVPLHRIALSATVPDARGVAERYLLGSENQAGYQIIEVEGGRRLRPEIVPISGMPDLVQTLVLRLSGNSLIRKTLLFCNTRNEVESTAAYLRRHLPFEAAIFVHYSNLDTAMRRQVEDDFAEAGVAICVSSSTLELGIDIGSIDDVALLGPPPTVTSFLQRIGRGGRRTGSTQVLCLSRSILEEVRFHALISLAHAHSHLTPPSYSYPTYHFRPSVLVQQIFSILKQSPTGGIRLADLRRVTPAAIETAVLERILNYLAVSGYLRSGRLGEWRADIALDDLIDDHEIYSNIGADPFKLTIVDAYSGHTIAQTDRIRLEGDTLLMGGRSMVVVWRDRFKIGVRPIASDRVEEVMRFHTDPLTIPFEVCQAVASYLELAAGQLYLIPQLEGAVLFHFWGDLYGTLLASLLQAHFGVDERDIAVTRINEHCLYLPATLNELPPWVATAVRKQLRLLFPRLVSMLELGRFHSLLPPDVAQDSLIEQCDLLRFRRVYQNAGLTIPEVGLRSRLLEIIS